MKNDLFIYFVTFLWGLEAGKRKQRQMIMGNLQKELNNDFSLKIMDKALEKFGSEIAIAFRYTFFFFGLGGVSLSRTQLTRDALCTGLPIGVEFSYPN